MPYQKLKVQKLTESDFRRIWKDEYCDISNPIYTFDDILVKFYEDMFDHAFYESHNKKQADKSILSLNRCQKMLWIKDALKDPTAIIKKGWLKRYKSYTNSRRVAIVKDNYVVIIVITDEKKAKFITAYEVNEEENLQKILNSPDWE